MSEQLTYEVLRKATESAAAFRCRRKLNLPAARATKSFLRLRRAVYAVEQRRVKGHDGKWSLVTCVLLDSVQSQANRMEESLQEAIDEKTIQLPLVEVDFSDAKLLEPIGRITSLQAPHRIADAISRQRVGQEAVSFIVGGKFPHRASVAFATPLLAFCPHALIFGLWDSTGPKGGLGTKFERAIVSEVVGVDAEVGIKSASRVDPIITASGAITLYRRGPTYTLASDEADKDKAGKPILFGNGKKAGKVSAANLGNVTPSVIDNETKKPSMAASRSTTPSRRRRFP